MRKYLFIVILTTMACSSFAQTNTFPASGNVGIGTTAPREKLEVVGKTLIQNTLKTNDYMYTGQHNGQMRILNGLGIYGTRALEMALLDNGTGIIQANESGVR